MLGERGHAVFDAEMNESAMNKGRNSLFNLLITISFFLTALALNTLVCKRESKQDSVLL